MKVAIVILNWNGCGMLRRFLPALVASVAGRPEAGLYVADNGSTDDSLAMLEECFPSVGRIVLSRNYGFAEGYNQALSQVAADYYFLLNSDVSVSEHWLAPLLDYMDTHPEAAACQPKILCWDQPDQFEYAGACGGFMDRWGYPFCRGRILDTLEKDAGQYDTVAPVFWASGAALLVRSADYWAAGGLDGRFFAHMEEIDLCWRLRSRGRMIVCVPQSVVWHVGGGTLKKENPRKVYLNFRNNLLMLYKNLPRKELGRVMFVRGLLDGVAALKYLVSGQVAFARSVMEARRDYRRMRKDYATARAENLRAGTVDSIPERFGCSILVEYYLKGRRRFSQLRQARPFILRSIAIG